MDIYTANKLLELRKKNNFSQEELAEKLNISRQAISKWERAESSPDTDNLIALARLYRISLDELLEINVKTQVCEEDPQTERKIISLKKESMSEAEELEEIFSANVKEDGEIYPQFQNNAEEIYPEQKKAETDNNNNNNFTSFNYTQNNNTVYQTNENNVNIVIPPKKSIFDFSNKTDSDFRLYYLFPYYAVAVILFFIGISDPFDDINIGRAEIEDLSWLWFLTIPLYYSAIYALKRKNANYFLYPILAVILFFLVLIVTNNEIALAMFATIPFYYFFVALKKSKKKK